MGRVPHILIMMAREAEGDQLAVDLSDRGFGTLACTHLESLFFKIQNQKFETIILEYLPEEKEFDKALKKLHSGRGHMNKDTPILVLADDDSAMNVNGLRLYVQDIIQKDVHVDDIAWQLREILRNRNSAA